ncbi:MAG: M20 family metallopeptidase [Chloroflexota bacterium]
MTISGNGEEQMTASSAERSVRQAADPKQRLAEAVQVARGEILELSHRIHRSPEPAFEEHQAAAWCSEVLARHGFRVELPVGRLATAIRATRAGGRDGPGPRVGILAEYDALPGLGHGCGHNTMAASAVGAAIALASMAGELAGEIVFLGTPAEERGSGKVTMIEDGLFDGIDAALLYHPCDRNHVDIEPLASVDADVVFHGRQAHAASDPWKGLNALDALIMLFVSVGLWRQGLRPDARVHGIVLEGGTAANTIPERTAGRFMLRSAVDSDLVAMQERFRSLCEAAATASGTTMDLAYSGGSRTMRTNRVLADRWVANALALGIHDEGDDSSYGSTDMTNVSWVCPSIHPDLAIAPYPTPGHTIEFRDAAAAPAADATTLVAATLVAQTAYDLFADPSLVDAAWREFNAEP